MPRTASAEQIRSAYRKLARKHHPDVNPGSKQAEESFKEISAAYDVLSSPEKRKLYDEFGHEGLRGGFDPEQARAYKAWSAGRAQAGQAQAAGEGFDFDLGDLFGASGFGGFGGDAEGFGRSRTASSGGRHRRGRAAAGADILASVEIDLAQALSGIELEIRVPAEEPCPTCGGSGDKPGTSARTCQVCGGSGRSQAVKGPMQILATCRACGGDGKVRTACESCGGRGQIPTERPITVRIPPGADDGSRLRVQGRGAPGLGGGPPGDLVIETRVRPHPWFRREGLDLHLRLPCTLAEAYEGTSVEVPTAGGSVKLRIPPRSQPGQKLRLRGQGVKRGGQAGDLYVELDVRLPDASSPEFEAAARAATTAYKRPVREGVRL